jgi:nucleotide-binding universal stress UspA family protein
MSLLSRPIVVGVALRDDDSAPLALAHTLARLTSAPLALVTSYPYAASSPFVTFEWLAAMRERAELALEPLAAGSPDDVRVSTHVRPEISAALALHDVAIELDAAAIVVGSSHRGRVGRVLAGSVTSALLHGAPCPVLVAPRDYTERLDGFRRIGVGFVNTLEGRAALSAACGLARATGGRVEVFSVQDPIEWSPALVMPGWSVPLAFEAEREQHALRTSSTARRLVPEDLLGSVEVSVGDPGTILATASANLDLLVCGSRGYGAVRSVILGSVSRELAQSSACPLLVVPRPPSDDAETPWSSRAATSPVGTTS